MGYYEKYRLSEKNESAVHQSENPYKREKLIYRTNGGVYVRTKSELIIGNFLEVHGIKYWYEAKFLLGGRWIYPDFLIENPNDHTIILEKNLICTYEEDIMEPGRLEIILHLFGIL